MAYETSESIKPKKQIGTFLFNVVAVNPTAAEIKAVTGWDREQKEQIYAKESKEGIKGISVVFWLKGKFGFKPLYFSLYDNEATSQKTGNKVWIDAGGNNTFAKTKEEITSQYVDKSTCRIAYRGEKEITDFMRSLLDRNPKEIKQCRIDDIKKILSGDLSEIKFFLKNYAKQACCLIYGDEKGYTNVWSGGFGGAYTLENEKYWSKKLGDSTSYGYPKGTVSIKAKDWDIKMDEDKQKAANPFDTPASKQEQPHHSTIPSNGLLF